MYNDIAFPLALGFRIAIKAQIFVKVISKFLKISGQCTQLFAQKHNYVL